MSRYKPRIPDRYHTGAENPEMTKTCLNCIKPTCDGYDGAMCDRLRETFRRGIYEMTLNEYGELAQRTTNCNHWRTKTINGALGLAGEAGEVADIVKKWLYQGHELDKEDAAKELGDVLWYCVEMAKGLGYTLEDIAKMNIEKLKRRYPEGFDAARSVNREE